MPRLVKIQMLIIFVLGIAIAAVGSGFIDSVNPNELASGGTSYALSVFCIAQGLAIIWTITTHRNDWNKRDEMDRAERKENRDMLNSIIAKCGK